MIDFPRLITFLSDDSEVELVSEIAAAKNVERAAVYIYRKRRMTLVKSFSMTLAHINRLNDAKLIICESDPMQLKSKL